MAGAIEEDGPAVSLFEVALADGEDGDGCGVAKDGGGLYVFGGNGDSLDEMGVGRGVEDEGGLALGRLPGKGEGFFGGIGCYAGG